MRYDQVGSDWGAFRPGAGPRPGGRPGPGPGPGVGYTVEFGGEDAGGFSEFFRTIFGGGFGGFGGGGPTQGRDLQMAMEITLEDVATGGARDVRIQRLEACDACGGSGARPGTRPRACGTCRGQGQVARMMRTPFGVVQTAGPCPTCRGRGEVVSEPDPACQGQGRVARQRTLSVTIPQGVPDGGTLRLRGEGEAGPDGLPPGDLYVRIRVKPHAVFEREGDDLHVRIPLTFSQAALGDEVDVPLLDGKRDRLSIPPGTQSGDVFRVRGRGLPALGGARKGDVLVHAKVYTPTKLSPEERALIEQLAKLEGREPPKAGILDELKRKFT